MITRLQLLRNIGQFDSVTAGATIPLAGQTLVYSENGRGKTTLAAVLRSLATGSALPITERQRLATQNPPHVVIECTGGPPPAVFENGAWSRTLPNMAVFDDVFIDENVHSGLCVEVAHRQHLHELILGAQAVSLSKALQQLITKVEAHNSALRSKASAIPTPDRQGMTVDAFCALPYDPDADRSIQQAEQRLVAARQQAKVATTPEFEELNLPGIDLPLVERVLQQDLPALDADTVSRLQAHFSALGPGGEAWVADGMRRKQGAGDSTCPFCAQELQGLPFVDCYRVFFSRAYTTLKSSVADAIVSLDREHSGDVPAAFERSVRVAVERRQFWSQFIDVAEIAIDTASIIRDWKAAREAVGALLTAKQAAPLEPMQLSEEVRALVATYDAHRTRLRDLDNGLREANLAIGVVKEGAAVADVAVLTADVSKLKATKSRHSAPIAHACDEYLLERTAKETTERGRNEKRAELEQLRAEVFPRYQGRINHYLQQFNAGFRLDSVTYADTRGGPTCTYNVLINNVPVAIGASNVPGAPSFRNTLSAGDRNTLALAFFFASLDQDTRLANMVVAVDDPISSLDEHRTLTTAQEIRSLGQRAAQVIVLSHNKPFLCRLWERADPSSRAALEVVRDASGSTLQTWDVRQDCITEHDRRHSKLQEYLTSGRGDKREMAEAIRPLLEAFLRIAYPEQYPPGTLLGPFLNVCRQRVGAADEILCQRDTDELGGILEYANRFHHDTNPAWETELVNDGELRGFVERAMKFAKRNS